jgi:CHAD domain-containing protein
VEGRRQISIALRRLRTTVTLFAPVVAMPEPKRLRDELRWFARQLAPTRDWDVLLATTLASYGGTGAAVEGLPALTDAALEARRDPLRKAVAIIEAPRPTRLLLALGAWLEDGRWYSEADPVTRALLDRPMADLAGGWLAVRLSKARKAGRKGPDGLDEGGRRKLCRHLRKLGHATDFFRGLYPPATTQAFVGALTELLDALDAEHDAAVSRERLRELSHEDAHHRPAAAAVLRWLDKQDARRRKALPGMWASFREMPGFW